jgi:uncharacterized protein YajQ (UPF0234 family)
VAVLDVKAIVEEVVIEVEATETEVVELATAAEEDEVTVVADAVVVRLLKRKIESSRMLAGLLTF